MKTAIKAIIDKDQQAAKDILKLMSRDIQRNNPKEHMAMLGIPYNPGSDELDRDNGIRRRMVELKILATFGTNHTCPSILLNVEPQYHTYQPQTKER